MDGLTLYAETELPTPRGAFRLMVFRTGKGDEEHLALVRGELAGDGAVLCRVHSECLTGEVLSSLRCDCRGQLERALDRIVDEGRGVLVYLRQEGRGIGLGNKIRAYALQDSGADTVEANLELGFDADARSYDVAAAILEELGVREVRLMTNNPDKIEGLSRAGLVVEAEPHWVAEAAHCPAYIEVKRKKLGHLHEPEPEPEPEPDEVSGA
jgi:GTP cyclohydrolase II